MDEIIIAISKDMENTNEDMDIAAEDLFDFLEKNGAILEEGDSYDQII